MQMEDDNSDPLEADYCLAEILLKDAANADRSGNYQAAFDLYEKSLGLWLGILKEEKRPQKQSLLMELINEYMGRAEQLKSYLASNPPVIANANPLPPQPPDLKQTNSSSSDNNSNRKKDNLSPSLMGTSNNNSKVDDYTNYYKMKPKNTLVSDNKKPIIKNAPTSMGNCKASNTRQVPLAESKKTAEEKLNEYEQQILTEMADSSPGVRWNDIAGLALPKQIIQEAVVFPYLRPDLFSGLRSPPKGVLLYGPPGTGKTMLVKAIATETGFNFFSLSASSITSKYLGEGEKLMKAVFAVARKNQPALIFFDEIDSLLSARKESEHEASRRLKTEFMVQIDGATTSADERILVVGATNIPWELDEAVLRRFVKRIYVPLPDDEARRSLIELLLQKQAARSGAKEVPSPKVLDKIVKMTRGYSASDLTAVCKEAAMGPIREIPIEKLSTIKAEEVRTIDERDFETAIQSIRPSVSNQSLQAFANWTNSYGSR